MTMDWLIIDGNNLVHHDLSAIGVRRGSDFSAVRSALARRIDELAGALARRVTIVYDGTRGGRDEAFEASSVEVIFSPGNMTADTVIERMVSEARNPGRVTVVTSDRGERDTVSAAGAEVTSCPQFIETLADQRGILKGSIRRHATGQGGAGGATLGDFFPEG